MIFLPILLLSSRTRCPNGTYSLGAQIKCTICLPGYSCLDVTKGPVTCPAGKFSEKNSEICQLCEPGKQCADPAGNSSHSTDHLAYYHKGVGFFHIPAAAHGSHPKTTDKYSYFFHPHLLSTVSVHKLLHANAQIHTITIFHTQHIPFLITGYTLSHIFLLSPTTRVTTQYRPTCSFHPPIRNNVKSQLSTCLVLY